MLPSCVPATNLENNGARLTSAELKGFISHPRGLGLGELMDYPGVLNKIPEIMDKLALAQHKLIDGHAPGISGRELSAYTAAGVISEHECTTLQEAKERLAQGMYLMLREGSTAKNLVDLLPAVNSYTADRCLFVTDDRHPEDLISLGHINHMVKLAVNAGSDLAVVLRMATLNAANYFRLYNVGAIAPGYKADILVFDNLIEWQPSIVYKSGKLVARQGKALFHSTKVNDQNVRNTMNLGNVDSNSLKIPAESARARVIGLVPKQLVTRELIIEVPVADGCFVTDQEKDILKIAVLERYKNTGNIGLGFVHGLGLKNGAIASTVAHDSHNLIVIGTNDEDMLTAINEIKRLKGGLAITAGGQTLGTLALPIAGLMSDNSVYAVGEELK